jgi:hypothetical protein
MSEYKRSLLKPAINSGKFPLRAFVCQTKEAKAVDGDNEFKRLDKDYEWGSAVLVTKARFQL